MRPARRRRPRHLAAAALLGILACGAPAPPNLDSPGSSIVCFGDSITRGVGAAPADSYPAQLAALLGIEVINAGVAGETSRQGLARLPRILAHDPWLVIVELGGNDILRRIPAEQTEASLRGIVKRLLEAGVLPVLVEVHGPFGGAYARLFRRLAREEGVPLVGEALPEILADPALKSDPIHPNAAGYRRLAEAVAEVVEPLLAVRAALP